MPMYEYLCQKCGARFEAIQKFVDAPLTEHESCGGAVERLISAPALQFKGSGWYITDYARSGSPGGKGGKNGGSESKSESKPESKESSTPAKAETSKSDTKPAKT
ncbi:MAG: zinc ribbon domain-containing protein [Bryobacterales bacterium]|nr:zinc ribbon domain-containing protein [Bryobacterales bacterium]